MSLKACFCLTVLMSHCRQHPEQHLLLCKDSSAIAQFPHCSLIQDNGMLYKLFSTEFFTAFSTLPWFIFFSLAKSMYTWWILALEPQHSFPTPWNHAFFSPRTAGFRSDVFEVSNLQLLFSWRCTNFELQSLEYKVSFTSACVFFAVSLGSLG